MIFRILIDRTLFICIISVICYKLSGLLSSNVAVNIHARKEIKLVSVIYIHTVYLAENI